MQNSIYNTQWEKFCLLYRESFKSNSFYQKKWLSADLESDSLDSVSDISKVPFTTKSEIIKNQKEFSPYGNNQRLPIDEYTRFHQSSGTSSGNPLIWLDTSKGWESILDSWREFYKWVGIKKGDVGFFPFSFGPFLGFWSAFEAAAVCGARVISGANLSSLNRLKMMAKHRTTFICATPSYLLHLLDIGLQHQFDFNCLSVEKIIVAGEPGGSIPSIRYQIEKGFKASLYDHSGMTEIGPLAMECGHDTGNPHLLESHFLCEVIPFDESQSSKGELVVTTLERIDSPLIRYRTGDLVELSESGCDCGLSFRKIKGGILSRLDDMFFIKGNNVYPAAVESFLREELGLVEYRAKVLSQAGLSKLYIEIEKPQKEVEPDSEEALKGLGEKFQQRFLFKANLNWVDYGSLPRFDLKANRWHFQKE